MSVNWTDCASRLGFGRSWVAWMQSLLAGIAAALAVSATPASAAPCLADAFGGPVVCKSTDVTLILIIVQNVSDHCAFFGDTFTFDGLFRVSSDARRFDIGIYLAGEISRDESLQALTGSCLVATIPAQFGRDLDGDNCGDSKANEVYDIPVSGVTLPCVDADHDGFFDVGAVCVSWKTRSDDDCSGPSDAIPSSVDDCNCYTNDGYSHEPFCANNQDCTFTGIPCLSGLCSYQDPRADGIGCAYLENDQLCNDNLFCNGVATCDEVEGCVAGPSPCDDNDACTIDTCTESTDQCAHQSIALCETTTTTLQPPTTTTTTGPDTTTTLAPLLCGDASGNGTVIASDALTILKAAVAGLPCGAAPCVCDANASGLPLTAVDALLVLKYAVGAPVTLNCPC